ncbi:tRNA 4-thiouridine(8) synthase ThiI [Paenibacillus glycanilyticus]|uniref:tRNA uracil 4-sulfurtransferase ThiI n=1 Tax=Paenibacillus glycanilyticus TaxID=126569 RepID=UPI002040E0D4|nr:tRNA uracil 4-sulfurtransferase ThiI [Paenibacillus glycanilyticus]MCM3626477.1 tRNA 4-thiouridine(8) synthase ThiI [Paenibacillus glycanilyticus]
MIYDKIIVRYGDLVMKGRNRNQFEKRMLQQIKLALQSFPALTYAKTFGRLTVSLNGEPFEAIAERLKDVFGIISFSPVIGVENELERIQAAALQLMEGLEQTPATFKVSAKRAWKPYPHTSQEMNHLVGSHVLRAFADLKVDVRNPEVDLRVDIQEEATYIYNTVIMGAGGFPFGSNGKAMLLLSGGIDSPVAGWMAMRKGLELEAVHFHSYPFTSDKAKEKVIDLARRLSYYAGAPLKLHLVPFTEIQTRLVQAKQDNMMITLMRRAMLRITEQLAERNDAGGIVTGESLGQVASQTLTSMNVIGRATVLPLLKPLLMMDKQEIINEAERIGTFATSILPYEDCCTLFLPKSPATKPNLNVVERAESYIPELEQMLLEAVERTEVLELTPETQAPEETAGEDRWF